MSFGSVVYSRIKGILFAAACWPLLLCPLVLEAQNPGSKFDPGWSVDNCFPRNLTDASSSLEVTVVNSSGPMSGDARVELRTMDGSTISIKQVGSDGSVRISDLLPGRLK